MWTNFTVAGNSKYTRYFPGNGSPALILPKRSLRIRRLTTTLRNLSNLAHVYLNIAKSIPKMPSLFSSFWEKHPRIYSFLYQTLLLIITFECAIAIARYGPERDGVNPAPASSTVRRTLLPRLSLPNTNSSTPHICVHGAREDYVDLGLQLTVRFHSSLSLSPSTSYHPLIHPLPPIHTYIHTNQKS